MKTKRPATTIPATIRTNAAGGLNPDSITLSFQYATGRPVAYYDDGFGPLWLYRDAGGLTAIVRCQSECDAYEIVQDEFLPEVSREDLPEAYGCYDDLRDYLVSQGHEDTYHLRDFACRYASAYLQIKCADEDNPPELIEGYAHAPNGPRTTDGTGVVSHDPNGETLEPLTFEILKNLEITTTITIGEDLEQ